jgi:hypothetical protein
MVEASRLVLKGHELRTDAKIVRSPDRYRDEKDEHHRMWDRAWQLIGEHGSKAVP